MGLYDTYGKTQLKVSEDRRMGLYQPGDTTDLPDGIYIGWEGAVVIKDGKFIGELPLHDKWGNEISTSEVLKRNRKDP